MSKYLFVLCVLSSSVCCSQDSLYVQPKAVFSLNLLNPGFQIEYGLNEIITLNYDFNVGFIYLTYGYLAESIKPTVQNKLQLRAYYNIDERMKKGKNISNYSANYGTAFFYYSPTRERTHQQIIDNLQAICFAWGLQRNYKSHIHFGLELGYGVALNAMNIDNGQGFPFIDYNFGFAF